MATYYNPSKPNNLRIKEFGLPDFANRYLQYLLIEKNAASGTIFNYAVSIRTFLRWVKMIDMGAAAPDCFADISVQDLSVNSIVSLQTSDEYEIPVAINLERSNWGAFYYGETPYRYYRLRIQNTGFEDTASPNNVCHRRKSGIWRVI